MVDLDSDCGYLLFTLGDLGCFGGDCGLSGFNGSLKSGDFFFDLGDLLLVLGRALLLLKIVDLLFILGDLSGQSLDVVFMLSSRLLMSVLLSLKVPFLSLNLLFSLLSSVSVDSSNLFDVVSTMNM